MHICRHEIELALYGIPIIGFAWAWLKAKWHHRKVHPTCKDK